MEEEEEMEEMDENEGLGVRVVKRRKRKGGEIEREREGEGGGKKRRGKGERKKDGKVDEEGEMISKVCFFFLFDFGGFCGSSNWILILRFMFDFDIGFFFSFLGTGV